MTKLEVVFRNFVNKPNNSIRTSQRTFVSVVENRP